jgi:hypothetical protein
MLKITKDPVKKFKHGKTIILGISGIRGYNNSLSTPEKYKKCLREKLLISTNIAEKKQYDEPEQVSVALLVKVNH